VADGSGGGDRLYLAEEPAQVAHRLAQIASHANVRIGRSAPSGGLVKKRTKKLVLNRETLARLQDDTLAAVAGGATTFQFSICKPCGTQETISPCTCATK